MSKETPGEKLVRLFPALAALQSPEGEALGIDLTQDFPDTEPVTDVAEGLLDAIVRLEQVHKTMDGISPRRLNGDEPITASRLTLTDMAIWEVWKVLLLTLRLAIEQRASEGES